MLVSTKRIKILLYGNIHSRVYRSKILIKFLQQDPEGIISHVQPSFYRSKILDHFELIEKSLIVLCWIELFIKAAFTDIVYLLPDNTRFIKSAIWITSLFRKKLVVEPYISLYDTFVGDRKLIIDGSRKAKVALEKDRLALIKSDYVIHTSSCELNYWGKIISASIDPNKIFVAPLCNTLNLVAKRHFRQDGVLRICWWGTFIPLHGLDNILKAMRILKEQEVQFTCNLFGVDNAFFSVYEQKIYSNQLENHVFLRKDLNFSDNSLPVHLVDNCDLALGIFGNTDKARNAVPNKLVEALSMGIPTLTMNSPALQEFFKPEDLWTCEPSPEAIAGAILSITSDAAYPVDWKQTRQKTLSTFSVTRYQEVVSKVLKRAANDFSRAESLDVEKRVVTTSQAVIEQVKH